MATVTEIEGKILEFVVVQEEETSRAIRNFARENVNVSGKDLEARIIRFLANDLHFPFPPQWRGTTLASLRSASKGELSEIDDKIPEFIKDNTKHMASNRGYMWQGKEYLGVLAPLPSYRGTHKVLFEPRSGRTLIHVWTSYSYKLFEKKKGSRYQKLIRTSRITPPALPNQTPHKDTDTDTDHIELSHRRSVRSGSFAALYDSDTSLESDE